MAQAQEPEANEIPAELHPAFAHITGHRRALEQLSSQLASSSIPHAYLFVGENRLGKTTVARALASALLPEVELDRHPDYWEDDRSGNLKLDELRLKPEHEPEHHHQTLQQFIELKPTVGERRVAVISNFGRIEDLSQNVLLKTIEEPHPGRVLILTTPSTSPFVVLPTIVSRCQRLAFHPVESALIEDLLAGREVEPVEATELAQLAHGRPGTALSMASDPQVRETHAGWAASFDRIFGAPALDSLRLAAEIDSLHMAWRTGAKEGVDPFMQALETWQGRLRRRMLDDSMPGPAARLLELSYDTLGHHEQHVSPRLNLEVFLLECRKVS